MNEYFISSWSGGKDSCLAYYYAIQLGLKPYSLINMLIVNPSPSLKKQVIEKQAACLNIPAYIQGTTWENYEKDFINTLKKIRKKNVSTCVFGDIDLEGHKKWDEKICQKVSLESLLPLWKKNRHELIFEFIELGFKATIVVVDLRYLDKSFVGREINYDLIKDLEKMNVDVCGENGEYHTVVTDGPIYSNPLMIQKHGMIQNENYCYLNFNIGIPRAAIIW